MEKKEMTNAEFLDALEYGKKVKGTLNLEARDWMTIGLICDEAGRYANNGFVTRDDVISGLLSFYRDAKLIDYHEQFNKDIAIYIGNRVQNMR